MAERPESIPGYSDILRRLKDEEGTYDPRFTILSTHPTSFRIKAAFEYEPLKTSGK